MNKYAEADKARRVVMKRPIRRVAFVLISKRLWMSLRISFRHPGRRRPPDPLLSYVSWRSKDRQERRILLQRQLKLRSMRQ